MMLNGLLCVIAELGTLCRYIMFSCDFEGWIDLLSTHVVSSHV